jgi:superfamily I DNA/RNA helicase
LKRKTDGFDFVFIDEAQLFNENERRIFPFLSKGTTPHAPVVLALDAAQEPFGFSSAGLAAVGITDVEDEELPSNHRSTQEIVDLAFYVIQQTTDLFGPDFPDFKKVEVGLSASQKALAAPPVIIECNEDAKSFGRFIVKTVQKLRAKNVRQIAVVCHGETYWEELRRDFSASQLPLHILAQRGERLAPDQPLVVLSRPNFVGGQEFDAVVLVGLEQGLVPPRVLDNAALAAAIEQQVLREMYLSITRARTRLIVAINQGAMPNSIIEAAKSQLLILNGTIN